MLSAEILLLGAVPAGHPDRERLAELVRIGTRFKEQQRGRRPGFLARYVAELVTRTRPATFEDLLIEIELDAVRRSLRGPDESPIEKVDRSFEVLTYHDPRHGRRQVSLKRIRNLAAIRSIP